MKKENMLRVLNDLNDDFIAEAAPRSLMPKERVSSWFNMRVLAGAMAVLVIALLSPLFLHKPSVPVDTGTPFTAYTVKSAAEEKAGFTITCPEKLQNCSVSEYRVYSIGILEAVYTNADEETVLTVRKAKGSEDISGDYTAYAEETTVTRDDIVITVKGDNGMYYLMTWTRDDCTYAVSPEEGLLPEEAGLLLDSIH